MKYVLTFGKLLFTEDLDIRTEPPSWFGSLTVSMISVQYRETRLIVRLFFFISICYCFSSALKLHSRATEVARSEEVAGMDASLDLRVNERSESYVVDHKRWPGKETWLHNNNNSSNVSIVRTSQHTSFLMTLLLDHGCVEAHRYYWAQF